MFPNDTRKIIFHFSLTSKYFVSHLNMQYNLHRLFILGWGGQVLLNEEQKIAVADYQRSRHESIQQELEARVRERLKQTATASRNVTPLFRVRCVDPVVPMSTQSAVLSVWRPSEDVMQLLKEGTTVTLFSVSAVGVR
jgi:hypothetical protein